MKISQILVFFLFLTKLLCQYYSVYEPIKDKDLMNEDGDIRWKMYCDVGLPNTLVEDFSVDGENGVTILAPHLLVLINEQHEFNNYGGQKHDYYRFNAYGNCTAVIDGEKITKESKFYIPVEYVKTVNVCPDIMRYPIFDFEYHPSTYHILNNKQFTESASIDKTGFPKPFYDSESGFNYGKGETIRTVFQQAYEDIFPANERSFTKSFFLALLYGLYSNINEKTEMYGPTPLNNQEISALQRDCNTTIPEDYETYAKRGTILPIYGRCLYQTASELIGEDLISFPDLAENPLIAFKVGIALFRFLYTDIVPNDDDTMNTGIDGGIIFHHFETIIRETRPLYGDTYDESYYFEKGNPYPVHVIIKMIRICAPYGNKELESFLKELAKKITCLGNEGGNGTSGKCKDNGM